MSTHGAKINELKKQQATAAYGLTHFDAKQTQHFLNDHFLAPMTPAAREQLGLPTALNTDGNLARDSTVNALNHLTSSYLAQHAPGTYVNPYGVTGSTQSPHQSEIIVAENTQRMLGFVDLKEMGLNAAEQKLVKDQHNNYKLVQDTVRAALGREHNRAATDPRYVAEQVEKIVAGKIVDGSFGPKSEAALKTFLTDPHNVKLAQQYAKEASAHVAVASAPQTPAGSASMQATQPTPIDPVKVTPAIPVDTKAVAAALGVTSLTKDEKTGDYIAKLSPADWKTPGEAYADAKETLVTKGGLNRAAVTASVIPLNPQPEELGSEATIFKIDGKLLTPDVQAKLTGTQPAPATQKTAANTEVTPVVSSTPVVLTGPADGVRPADEKAHVARANDLATIMNTKVASIPYASGNVYGVKVPTGVDPEKYRAQLIEKMGLPADTKSVSPVRNIDQNILSSNAKEQNAVKTDLESQAVKTGRAAPKATGNEADIIEISSTALNQPGVMNKLATSKDSFNKIKKDNPDTVSKQAQRIIAHSPPASSMAFMP